MANKSSEPGETGRLPIELKILVAVIAVLILGMFLKVIDVI
jgi:hypothetical protein